MLGGAGEVGVPAVVGDWVELLLSAGCGFLLYSIVFSVCSGSGWTRGGVRADHVAVDRRGRFGICGETRERIFHQAELFSC